MPAEIGQHCALLGNLHAVKGYTAPGPREAARAFKSALEHLDEAAAIADAHGQVEVLAALRVNIDHVLVALDELEDYLH
jgi:hypothetical protein